MHTKTLRAIIALALLAVIGAVIAGCGSSSTTSGSSNANAADKAFVAQMIPHHQMAVQMAQSAKQRGGHADTTKLAGDIISAQDAEIAQMRTLAKSIGVKPAAMPSGSMSETGGMAGDAKALGLSMKEMGMSMNMAMLDKAKPFDRAFIDMMIPHHQGAIRMARAELAKGKDTQLKKIATGIVAAQTREIAKMNSWRKGWYGAASPAGGVPAA